MEESCGEDSILLVGDAPGDKEDEVGLPFQGQSGVLLDQVLTRANVNVIITSCVRCKTPPFRKALPEELRSCSVYLNEEIAELNPKAIITLGRVPFFQLMPTTDSNATLAPWINWGLVTHRAPDGGLYPLYARYDPKYILKNSSKKAEYIADFVELLQEIDNE